MPRLLPASSSVILRNAGWLVIEEEDNAPLQRIFGFVRGTARYRIEEIRYQRRLAERLTSAFDDFNHPNLALANLATWPLANLATWPLANLATWPLARAGKSFYRGF